MLILLPIPATHALATDVNIGKTVALVPIDLLSIRSINEGIDDLANKTIIKYKGVESDLVLDIPFVEVMEVFNRMGLVDASLINYCAKISPAIQNILTPKKL